MAQVYFITTDALQTAGAFDALCETLSPARREKIARARWEADKRRLLCAGLLLDRALRPYGLREREAGIILGAHGKPYLAGRNDLFFNLSHSGKIVLCAVSDQEIGADVQIIRSAGDALMRRVCPEEEYAALAALPEQERQALFFRLWTAKESYLKWRGTGLLGNPGTLTLLHSGRIVSPEDHLFFRAYALPGYAVCICGRDPVFPPEPTFVTIP